MLPPVKKDENGYRLYDRESLLVLQQILFFREMDLPLEEIRLILSQPDFNLLESLENHHMDLMQRKKRIETLISTVERTINSMEGKIKMSEEAHFNGFDENKYAEEAKARWGNSPQYKESQKKWSSYSAQKKKTIMEEGGRIFTDLVGTKESEITDKDVQHAVKEYFEYLNQYFYTCNLEFLKNLADGWVEDPRFSAVFEKIRTGGAEFAREAIHHFVDKHI